MEKDMTVNYFKDRDPSNLNYVGFLDEFHVDLTFYTNAF